MQFLSTSAGAGAISPTLHGTGLGPKNRLAITEDNAGQQVVTKQAYAASPSPSDPPHRVQGYALLLGHLLSSVGQK